MTSQQNLFAEESSIRLRRLDSYVSTTSTLPPYSENETGIKLVSDDKSSIYTTATIQRPNSSFQVDKIFQINAQGVSCAWNAGLWNEELEVGITSVSTNGAWEGEKYRSIRPDHKSGSCTLYLSDQHDGSFVPVSETAYRFGPGRPPVVKLLSFGGQSLAEEFSLNSTWGGIVHRTVSFTSPRFGSFTWRYADRAEKRVFKQISNTTVRSAPDNLLILERARTAKDPFVAGYKAIEVARMIRNEETRAQGSRRYRCEGNGGRVEIDLAAFLGAGAATSESEQAMMEVEVFVLSTCLVMLKKEIDRQGSGSPISRAS